MLSVAMATYVALLRSVNVAGHGRLSMADVQRSFLSLGHTDVSTYIQTGNVLFRTRRTSMAALVDGDRAPTGAGFREQPGGDPAHRRPICHAPSPRAPSPGRGPIPPDIT